MIKIKNMISLFISFIIIIAVIQKRDVVIETILDIRTADREIIIQEANAWEKQYEFKYFTESINFIPTEYNDLVQIFYTILNRGWNEFTFYCGEEYDTCLDDVATLSYNQKFLAEINNFIHPYNSYTTIRTIFDDTGEITIKIDKLYSAEEILRIDNDINKLMSDNLTDDMTIRDKIKKMHDVIINSTKYDQERAKKNNSKYDSSRIQGVLYDHYAICSGYTDVMAVILSKLNVPNFKVASEQHIWNAVYIDDKWYHLDLTWDDPVSSSGKDILLHDFFLINDSELTKLDKESTKREHIYNKEIYLEFNEQ